MIYYFTGHPKTGKTTLAFYLKNALETHYKVNNIDKKCLLIDSQSLRKIILNQDLSESGRRFNIHNAHNIALYLNAQNQFDVILCMVSPYLDLREKIKKQLGSEIIEILVETSQPRPNAIIFENYEKPKSNFIQIDTTNVDVFTSVNELLNKIEKYGK